MTRPSTPTLTPAQRLAWAVSQSQRTLTDIAEHIGCSHAALSQWLAGKTEAENIKAALLQRFCDLMAVEMRWILTGEGPARAAYPAVAPPLVRLAQEISAEYPAAAEQAERVLRALMPGESHSH